MEGFCDPYSGKISISSYCFAVLNFCSIDSIFFSSFIMTELFLHKPSLYSKPDHKHLFLCLLIIVCNFSALSLSLFYLDTQQVALAEVASLILQILLWLIVFSCYYNYYNPYEFCKSPLGSIKVFVIFRIFCFFYLGTMVFTTVPEEYKQIVIMCVRFSGQFFVAAFVFISLRKKKLDIEECLLEESNALNEYEKSGVFSKLSMNWTIGLMKLGNTRPLEMSDAGNIRKEDSAAILQENLQKYKLFTYNSSENYGLLKTIILCFKWELLVISLIGLLSSFLSFSMPIFIALLTNFLESNDPLWKGITILIYFTLVRILNRLVASQYEFLKNLLLLKVKNSLSCEIFEKLLKITSSSISQSKDSSQSYGKIVNLIQVDVECITNGLINLIGLIILMLTLIFSSYLIFITIGWQAGLAATIIILLLLYLNILLGNKLSITRKSLMEKKDIRMKATSELLSNIRIFKLYNWEEKLSEKISEARKAELTKQSAIFIIRTLSIFTSWGSQNYIIAGIIITFLISGKMLTPTSIYSGVGIVRVVKNSLYNLPVYINSIGETKISAKRIQDYLRIKEQVNYIQKNYSGIPVSVRNSSFTWKYQQDGDDGEFKNKKRALKDLNFRVDRGELICVVGKLGSGKSSLLQALIQNLVMVPGEDSEVSIDGNVAYCNQESWILNMTVRDNILFCKDLDERKYSEVIRVSMLESDLEMFPGGDLTEIGERGINLSGGQKAKVCIARSIYADADIYLFDDSLAALDQYTANNLFERCILNYLKGKTRILVTNSQQYLSHADRILVLKNGEIIQSGTYKELCQTQGYFLAELMVELKQAELNKQVQASTSIIQKVKENKLLDSEERTRGNIKLSVYSSYAIYAGGWPVTLIAVLIMALWQANQMYIDLFLADWTEQSKIEQDSNNLQNISVFGIGSVTISILIILRCINIFSAGLRAARKLFKGMMRNLLDASIPLFFDTNPIGRVLNRLSKDQNTIDSDVIILSNFCLTQICMFFMHIIFCVYTVPSVILIVPITIWLARKVQRFYLSSSREITRLESISRSPIIQLFSECLNGISTIRAFCYQNYFKTQYIKLIDTNMALNFYKFGCTCWLSIMLELVAGIVLACSTLIIVFSRDSVNSGLAGACLTYAMMIPEDIDFIIYGISALENSMVSVERVINTNIIEKEDNRVCAKDENLIKNSWPQKGQIEFLNFSARYRPDTDLVLKNLTFSIKSNEKVGIIGRTGSGKSSLVNSLFRVISAEKGVITIDNINIAEIGLNLLRQQLCAIPQDPALFSGKLRDNIDPLGKFTDEKIEKILRKVELDLGIDYEISDTGSNLSVGQKQLVCISRALLRGSKIVVLDEATASIDFKTDILIQKILRKEFKASTVITIAHRINSILNSDRILVLDKGKVVKFDTPEKLKEFNHIQ